MRIKQTTLTNIGNNVILLLRVRILRQNTRAINPPREPPIDSPIYRLYLYYRAAQDSPVYVESTNDAAATVRLRTTDGRGVPYSEHLPQSVQMY